MCSNVTDIRAFRTREAYLNAIKKDFWGIPQKDIFVIPYETLVDTCLNTSKKTREDICIELNTRKRRSRSVHEISACDRILGALTMLPDMLNY